MKNLTHPSFALRVALIFAAVSAAWILVSNRVTELLATDINQLALLETLQGWTRVGVIAILLYVLLRREAHRQARVEATLQEAQVQYSQLFEANPLPCWVYDAEHLTVQMMNTAALLHYGYSREEFLALKIQDLHPAEDVPLLLDYHGWLVQGNLPIGLGHQTVWHQHKKDGTPIKVELMWTYLPDRKAVLVVVNDITLREEALAALRESEARFRSYIEQSFEGMVLLDEEGRIIEWNQAQEQMTGLTRAEVMHLPFWDVQFRVLPPEQRPSAGPEAFKALLNTAFHTGQLPEPGKFADIEIQTTTGERKIIQQAAFPIETPQGYRMAGIFRDITERKRAEAALRVSEERFRRVVENIPDVITVYDPELRIQYINAAARRLTGRSVEDYVGRRDTEVSPPGIYETYLSILQQALATGETCTMVTTLAWPDSGSHNLQITYVPLLNESGAVHEVLGITHDFTEVQRSAEALRQYAERLKVVHEVGRASLAGQLPQNIAELTLEMLLRIVPYQRGTITWISSHTDEAVGVTRVNDRPVPERHNQASVENVDDQRSTINVPLYSRSDLIGTLNLQADRSAPFTTQDIEIVREAADELTLALQHAQLFEQVRTGRDRMELLSRRLLDIQETERHTIARELHDEIGQALTAIKIDLQALQRISAGEATAQLGDSIEVVDQTLQQVRDLSLDLRPSLLDDLGLPAALRWYVDRQVQRAGLEAAFNVDTVRERLLPSLETVCFRVVQEAVTNIVRHAHAQRIYLELVRNDEQLLVSVQDDGLGFEVNTARARAVSGASLGLLGMEERVWLSGGELEIESTPGRGTTVRARLPFRPRSLEAMTAA